MFIFLQRMRQGQPDSTNWPCPACWASWSKFDTMKHLWHCWRILCRYARTGISSVAPSCAWKHHPDDRSQPNVSAERIRIHKLRAQLMFLSTVRTSIALLPQPIIWPVPMYATDVGISPHWKERERGRKQYRILSIYRLIWSDMIFHLPAAQCSWTHDRQCSHRRPHCRSTAVVAYHLSLEAPQYNAEWLHPESVGIEILS